MENVLSSLSAELANSVERAGPSVVAVHGRPRFPSSGVLWRPGVVVTAEHTLRNTSPITVTLPDHSTVEAELAGRDPATDVAALHVRSGIAAPAMQPAPVEAVKPGTLAMVLGRSRDSGTNATLGIISAVSGTWRTWRGGAMERYIRLDATLYPGSSGGAVINAAGQIVGIATSALSRIAGLAIPAETVERVVADLLSKGRVTRGYLGVGLQPVGLPEHLKKQTGAEQDWALIVLSVEPGGPADSGGVLVGDILIRLNETPVSDTNDVQTALEGVQPGAAMRAKLIRGGAAAELTIALGERPGRTE